MRIKLQLYNGKIWEIGELEDERDLLKIEEILSESPLDFLILLPIYLKSEDVFKSFYVEPMNIKAVILQNGNVIRVWEVSRYMENTTNHDGLFNEKEGLKPLKDT